MKKVLLVFAVLAITASSFAQTKFGIKAGANLASAYGNDFDGTDGRIGLVVGAFTKFEISEKFYFQPELLYSSQGVSSTYYEVTQDKNLDAILKLSYLNIPLMAKFYPYKGFNLQAGPQLGILLSAKQKFEVMRMEDIENIKDFCNDFDFGLNLGLGYDFPEGFGIDFRYNIGLTNIEDYDDADGKNKVFQLTASYAF